MSDLTMNALFAGRKLFIATKHKKEQVIAPIFISKLQAECVSDVSIDTDLFGTFAGETDRVHGVVGTARNICGFPTRFTLSHVYQCAECKYTEEKKYPHGIQSEDPPIAKNIKGCGKGK